MQTDKQKIVSRQAAIKKYNDSEKGQFARRKYSRSKKGRISYLKALLRYAKRELKKLMAV